MGLKQRILIFTAWFLEITAMSMEILVISESSWFLLNNNTKCSFHGLVFMAAVQTGTTTPNTVAPTMLGVVACMLVVVCKRMQQLPTSLGPAVHRRKNTTHKSLLSMRNECVLRSRNKRNVGSCWLKSLTGFKLCATTCNNIQQHATACANGRNM